MNVGREERAGRIEEALTNLFAMVNGEVPSLLRDHWLAGEIASLLASPAPEPPASGEVEELVNTAGGSASAMRVAPPSGLASSARIADEISALCRLARSQAAEIALNEDTRTKMVMTIHEAWQALGVTAHDGADQRTLAEVIAADLARLQSGQDEAVAAAVERCAKIADDDNGKYEGETYNTSGPVVACRIARAIRRRQGGER